MHRRIDRQTAARTSSTKPMCRDAKERLAEVFERVGRRLLEANREDEAGRMLAAPGLKTAGKFYAFTINGDLIVKLPAVRVTELIASGAGRSCRPSTRRPMREWVRFAFPDEHTAAALLREARTFVRAQEEPKAAQIT